MKHSTAASQDTEYPEEQGCLMYGKKTYKSMWELLCLERFGNGFETVKMQAGARYAGLNFF
ncbi:MAG: hypothetical protein JW864_14335 [Spirochaetes bacterium]|nr:hypothetical protein [Spirochaetota bacterium]